MKSPKIKIEVDVDGSFARLDVHPLQPIIWRAEGMPAIVLMHSCLYERLIFARAWYYTVRDYESRTDEEQKRFDLLASVDKYRKDLASILVVSEGKFKYFKELYIQRIWDENIVLRVEGSNRVVYLCPESWYNDMKDIPAIDLPKEEQFAFIIRGEDEVWQPL